MPGITDPSEEYFKDGVWGWDPTAAEWEKLETDESGHLRVAGVTGAPTDTQYVTGAADPSLSAELVLGTAVIMAGAAASIPSASLAGRLYFETDTGKLRRDNGTAWVEITPTPLAHAATHQNGGADEISVAALSGELADDQPPKSHALAGAKHDADTLANLNAKVSDATLDDSGDPRDPNAHAASHKDGGSDELDASELAGAQGTSGQRLQTDGAACSWVTPTGAGFYDAYVCVRDKKTQGTYGGTFTSGAWRTRDINEELADTASICSIASNQITLAAGTYRCIISAPAYLVGQNQLRLYNITDSAVLLVGQNCGSQTSYGSNVPALLAGRFTLAAQKTLEVQHQCGTTENTWGFGNRCNFTDEIYTIAEFWREA